MRSISPTLSTTSRLRRRRRCRWDSAPTTGFEFEAARLSSNFGAPPAETLRKNFALLFAARDQHAGAPVCAQSKAATPPPTMYCHSPS